MRILPNQLVELHVENTSGRMVLRTRVEDVEDDLIIVGAPIHRGALVPIRVGTDLVIEFKSTAISQEGRFRNVAVVERRLTDPIPLLQLRLKGEWVKTQDRRFVRVPVFIDAVFVPVRGEEKLDARLGVILNLSGGGFLLRTSFPFEADDQVEVSFTLEGETVKAAAYLARLVPNDEGFDFGFAFIDLPEPVRMHIIQYVYKRQIELRDMAREDSSVE
ncbi:MAG: flagellar brake protein [Firmicutes bacterium]|jgi:c-di-GMP-binding flagellar brake protein YcgR|nr:flagellar brake protein [Bacillota bacterium]NLO65629.1 flagellar brake protein [Bacillota bacterium]